MIYDIYKRIFNLLATKKESYYKCRNNSLNIVEIRNKLTTTL